MAAVKVSPKFQVVIPREVREYVRLEPGQRVEVFAIGRHIEIVPVRPMREMRGSLRGMDTTIIREPDRYIG